MDLPANLNASQFTHAIEEFSGVVGKDWVFADKDHLNTYRDLEGPLANFENEPIPSAAVAPHTVEEVQEIVKIANKYRVPLWVISCGRNFGYGGPASCEPGDVVLDLKRMNRIIDVDEKLCFALVEPGVSTRDLYDYLHANDINLWIDGPSPAWASIVGSSLERGLGHNLMRERWANHCGMEVVLPDGDLIRTNLGAISGNGTWQHSTVGFGPDIDGMFSQSNFGIVTKMGTRLARIPEASIFGRIIAPRTEDLVQLIDILRPLRFQRIIENLGFALIGKNTEPDTRSKGRDFASASFGFYGLPKVVDLHMERIKDICSVIPGVRFEIRRFSFPFELDKMEDFDRRRHGYVSMSERKRWEHTDIYFSQILPLNGEEVWKAISVFDEIHEKYGLEYRASFSSGLSPRSLTTPTRSKVDPDNPEVTRHSVAFGKELIKTCGKHGWASYRVGPVFMDEVMAEFNYNNHALLRFHEKIKDGIDPNGIIAPGKSGIWPKYLREKNGKKI